MTPTPKEQELLIKSKEELLTYIENMKVNYNKWMNDERIMRDNLHKEIRELKLQNKCLLVFKERITRDLNKIIRDMEKAK